MEYLKGHSIVHEESREKYPCAVCSKQLLSKLAWRKHMEVHDRYSREKFPCQSCGKVLSSKDSLKNHISAIHEKSKK